MTAPRVRRPLLRAAGFGALAAALVAAACETPGPVQPAPGGNRRLYAAEGEAEGLPRIDLRAIIARSFPEVARDGLPADRYLYLTLSPGGDVIGHEILRRAPGRGAQTTGDDGTPITVTGMEAMAAMRSVDKEQVRSIDRMVQPAGAVAPTPVTVVVVQMKEPGEKGFRVSSSDGGPAPGTMTKRTIEGRTRDDGFAMVATTAEPHPATPVDQQQLQAAMARFYTPAMKAAGVRGAIDITLSVSAEGRPYDIVVNSENPQLVPVGRAIAESLTFPAGTNGRGRRINLLFDPHPIPSRSR